MRGHRAGIREAHAFGWFQALGFRMGEMTASRYLGMGRIGQYQCCTTKRGADDFFVLYI